MSPVDREQAETGAAALGIVGALWAAFKLVVTPQVVTLARDGLAPEIRRLEEAVTRMSDVATRLEVLVERVQGHEHRIQMLEDR